MLLAVRMLVSFDFPAAHLLYLTETFQTVLVSGCHILECQKCTQMSFAKLLILNLLTLLVAVPYNLIVAHLLVDGNRIIQRLKCVLCILPQHLPTFPACFNLVLLSFLALVLIRHPAKE